MRRSRALWLVLFVIGLSACKREPASTTASPATPPGPAPAQSTGVAFVCPMDRDVRSSTAGTCPRCGMALVAGIPEPTEYHLDLSVSPDPPKPNEQARLTFEVSDPWKDRPVEKFSVVHEKLFHAFVVSRDLQFFAHDHPVWENGSFQYDIALPKPGMYRILGDFYPEGATPQLITRTMFVEGPEPTVVPLTRDYSPKQAANLAVSVSTSPANPVAGLTTQMRFTVEPADGIEKYLGAWGHMLAASDDLIDMIHTHPALADGSPEMHFTVVFPRPRMYRLWVQFQRKGVVNTATFDIPVQPHGSTPTLSN